MNERTSLDRIRDLVDGRLDPAAADAVLAEIAADPALRSEFDAYQEVHALTAAASAVPPCEVEFDALSGGGANVPRTTVLRFRWRWAVAAAVLAAAALGAGASLLRTPQPREVALAVLASPEGAPTVDDGLADPVLPETLSDFRAAADGRMRWVEDYEEGVVLAKATGLPMLVFVHFPGCPMCVELESETFGDAAVQERADAFVPLRIDAREAPKEFMPRYEKGWPYVAAIDGDGEVLEEFPGVRPAPDMATHLASAAGAAAKRHPRADAAGIRAAVAALRRGDDARASGRLGESFVAYSDAASRNAGLVSEVAATAARSVRRQATTVLALARERSLSDADAAADELESAARGYSGSPLGDDLAAVAAALRDTGVFPHLKESKR